MEYKLSLMNNDRWINILGYDLDYRDWIENIFKGENRIIIYRYLCWLIEYSK